LRRRAGPEHLDTAASLNSLAMLYQAISAYAEAAPLYEHALAIMEKTLGPEHPNTATALNNLALIYQATGTYAKAEPLLERALAIREKALGLWERALAIREKVLGPEHPDTAASLNNLAALLQAYNIS
jgi:tetratricopeptide (TPR) repeat protein